MRRRLALCSALDVGAVAYGHRHLRPSASPFAYGATDQLGPLLAVTLVSSLATVDAILAKMSGRVLLPVVVPLTALLLGLALAPGGWTYAIGAVCTYHLLAVSAVCEVLHLPLLRKVRISPSP